MQQELESSYPNIHILGVNAAGYESSAVSFSAGLSLPFLQDVDANDDGASDTWVNWGVTPRDVVILDANNIQVNKFNLSDFDLENESNFATLRQMLIAAGSPAASSGWQNPTNHLDVNNDGSISPVGDVLSGINELNNRVYSDAVTGKLITPPTAPPPFYYDVNGDGFISPTADVLPIINYLNSNNASGEGEGVGAANLSDAIALAGSSGSAACPADSSANGDQALSTDGSCVSAVEATPATIRSVDRPWPCADASASASDERHWADADDHPMDGLLDLLAEDLVSVWYGESEPTAR